MEINHDIETKILSRKWFYRFHLPSGRITETYIGEGMLKIHETREQMMNQVLETEFANKWENLNCIDFACHEGYFSHKLALKGCKKVIGVDIRSEHIEHANLIREVFACENLSFQLGDVQKLEASELGSFDVTLLFGVLYHIENIVGVLRLVHGITKKVCLIETQIAPNVSGMMDWGASRVSKNIIGSLAIIDESRELNAQNMEANTSPITLVPSLPGLLWLLKAVGFKDAQVISPRTDAYEQFVSGNRVMVAAYN